jgi:sugar phosphate isomerase/epimerase
MFRLALHSVSYAGFWPGQARLPVEQVVAKAAGLGFDAVMLMAKRPHLSLLDMTSAARREIKSVADGHGVCIAVLAGYNDFGAGAEVRDVPLGEMQVYYIGELARLAADLACPLVRVFTAFERDVVPFQAAWDRTVACLREAARRARDFGVILGVQNHHDLAVQADSFVDLLQEVDEPNCKACFDAWAPALQGGDPAAEVKRIGPLLAHTTVADYVRRQRFRCIPEMVNYTRQTDAVRAVPMGEGFIDYSAFFQALDSIRYAGTVAYEMCSPLRGGGSEENLDRCAAAFVRFMRERQ